MTQDIIADIIEREGGYVDRTEDRGGPTKFGITQKTLSQWRKHPCQKTDIENLTEAEARQILTELFLFAPGFVHLNDPNLRAFMTDWGVNSGPTIPVKALQQAMGTTADGIIGPSTLKAANQADASALYKRLYQSRLHFIGHLIGRDASQAIFAEGWLDRMAALLP